MNNLTFDFEAVVLRDVTDSESDGIRHFFKIQNLPLYLWTLWRYTNAIIIIIKTLLWRIRNFCSTMCWLWRNILHTCLRSLGQIDWKYTPKYGRFLICTIYKHLEVPLQITMIFIIHC